MFYRALLTEAEPADPDLEWTVLNMILGNQKVAAWAVPFLSIGDFTVPEIRKRFSGLKMAWEGSESKTASPKSYDAVLRLRRVTAERTARTLAWRLVRSAHNMPPEKFAAYAVEKLTQFAARVNDSGLGGSNGIQIEYGKQGEATGGAKGDGANEASAGKDEQPGKAIR